MWGALEFSRQEKTGDNKSTSQKKAASTEERRTENQLLQTGSYGDSTFLTSTQTSAMWGAIGIEQTGDNKSKKKRKENAESSSEEGRRKHNFLLRNHIAILDNQNKNYGD